MTADSLDYSIASASTAVHTQCGPTCHTSARPQMTRTAHACLCAQMRLCANVRYSALSASTATVHTRMSSRRCVAQNGPFGDCARSARRHSLCPQQRLVCTPFLRSHHVPQGRRRPPWCPPLPTPPMHHRARVPLTRAHTDLRGATAAVRLGAVRCVAVWGFPLAWARRRHAPAQPTYLVGRTETCAGTPHGNASGWSNTRAHSPQASPRVIFRNPDTAEPCRPSCLLQLRWTAPPRRATAVYRRRPCPVVSPSGSMSASLPSGVQRMARTRPAAAQPPLPRRRPRRWPLQPTAVARAARVQRVVGLRWAVDHARRPSDRRSRSSRRCPLGAPPRR